MQGYHIHFFRHGRTAANEQGIYIGQTDMPLSDKGRAELAMLLDEHEYPKVGKVYSSPLERCIETAEILYPDTELLPVAGFRELNFGQFEGKSIVELLEREDYMEWIRGGMDCRPPEGESMEELCLRLYKSLHGVILDMMNQEIREAAVVTHAGIISCLLSCFGLPKLDRKELTCDPGMGFEIYVTAQLWQQGQTFEILGRDPEY